MTRSPERSNAGRRATVVDPALIDITAMPGFLIRRMHQTSQAVFDREVAAAGFDLTPLQFAALAVVSARPGIDQASLAEAIVFDRPTTGGVVDRLEAKGLLRRETTAADRRLRQLHLKPAGRALLDAVKPVVERVQRQMLSALTAEERKALLHLLAKAQFAQPGKLQRGRHLRAVPATHEALAPANDPGPKRRDHPRTTKGDPRAR